MNTIERKLQISLNNIQSWATNNGFKFSKTKTKCVHFCKRRGLHLDPELRLGTNIIPVVPEYKFLGVIFDRKLAFISHIQYLKAKCQKALNLMRVVANNDWGADRKVLHRLYIAHVRSKLDYGCTVYGSASKSTLQMLDPIHHQGLRLVLGAFRTSNSQSLYAEANEPSLHDRRQKLSLQYATKIYSNTSNPARSTVFHRTSDHLFERKASCMPPFGFRVDSAINDAGIDLDHIAKYTVPRAPPWQLEQPKVIFDLTRHIKSSTDPSIFRSDFYEIKDRYSDYTSLYTDGSKDGDRVGAAAATPQGESKRRLPDKSSIYSAELRAILLALDWGGCVNGGRSSLLLGSLSYYKLYIP